MTISSGPGSSRHEIDHCLPTVGIWALPQIPTVEAVAGKIIGVKPAGSAAQAGSGGSTIRFCAEWELLT